MKRDLIKFTVLLSFIFASFQIYGQSFIPKYTYDKYNAYINNEAKKWQDRQYQSYYTFAPYTGVDKTPVMYLLIYDYANNKVFLQEHGVRYDNGDPVYFVTDIPMSFTTPYLYDVSGECYIVQDLNDGRGTVARRKSFYTDPIDRGSASSYSFFTSDKRLYWYNVNDKEALKAAFSRYY